MNVFDEIKDWLLIRSFYFKFQEFFMRLFMQKVKQNHELEIQFRRTKSEILNLEKKSA